MILFHQYILSKCLLKYSLLFDSIFAYFFFLFFSMRSCDLVVLSLFWISRRFSYWILNANPIFQGILIQIIQILHYYSRNQHKYRKFTGYLKKSCYHSLTFSLFKGTCSFLRLPQQQSLFSLWTPPRIFNVISDHSCRI